MAFLVNPFLFFYYEEKEEQERLSKVGRENEAHRSQGTMSSPFLAHLRGREVDDWLCHLPRCSHHSRVGQLHSLNYGRRSP